MKLENNTILITGGGSGIGLALAKEFLRLNNHVIICGRDLSKLQKVKSELQQIEIFRCDISDQASINILALELKLKFSKLNFLINNAGTMDLWDLSDQKFGNEFFRAEIQTNLIGTIQLTQALLPILMNQSNSAILNVTSALAFVPMAAAPIYSATKAALHSYTISLRQQTGKTGVKVFELLPAAIDTDMATTMEQSIGFESKDPKMPSAKLAMLTIKSLRKDNFEIRPGMANILYTINQLFPSAARGMIAKQSEKIINQLRINKNEYNG